MSIGRNEPCPCGSGRKYKHCCLSKQAGPTPFFRDDDRRSAAHALLNWAAAQDDELQRAADFFWGQALDQPDEDDVDQLMCHESAFNLFYLVDHVTADGRSQCERYLATRGRSLGAGELEYLRRLQAARWRAYEVREVDPGAGFVLTDLLSHETYKVREQRASQAIPRWEVLVVRPVEVQSGLWELEGGALAFPPRHKRGLLEAFERRRAALRAAQPELDDDHVFRAATPAWMEFWWHAVHRSPAPRLVTAHGEPLVFCRSVFDIEDRAAVELRLAAMPDDVEAEDGAFIWFEPIPGGRRSLGRITFGRGRLVLETQSEERAARGRRLLEERLGGLVRFRRLRRQSPEKALLHGHRRKRRSDPTEEIPPEVAAQLVQQSLDEHYRTWPDIPVPALDGATPRAAAADPELRERLVDLLKEFEHSQEAARRAGRGPYDFGWLWAELGLARP